MSHSHFAPLQRFLAMRRRIPFVSASPLRRGQYARDQGPVDWDAYLADCVGAILFAFENALPTVIKLVQDTNKSLYSPVMIANTSPGSSDAGRSGQEVVSNSATEPLG